jgi:protein-tyrosine phosphatase
VQFLADADITAIINLTGKMDRMVEDVDYFDYALPSSELLETEFQKTITKLEAIMSDLSELRNNNRNVLIHCLDGKNKSMLAAGYYLITRCGKKADATIDLLE